MLLRGLGDQFFIGSVGEDIFGESFPAQIARQDDTNRFLFMKLMREYVQWHEQHARFYPGYEADKSKLWYLSWFKYGWASAGVAFAACIVNPNYVSKRGFYLRKFNVLLFGLIGYQWGRKKQDFHLLNMMLKMHDYFPHEVKRALQSKDHRHLALFNWENPGRQLFDEETGKSLS